MISGPHYLTMLFIALVIFSFSAHELHAQGTAPVFAQSASSGQNLNAPSYDKNLQRVSELIGALTYLSDLCAEHTAQQSRLRQKMQAIIEADTANEPERKRQLIAKFNKGYRSFSSVYTGCTDRAKRVIANYRQESTHLVEDMLARFSN